MKTFLNTTPVLNSRRFGAEMTMTMLQLADDEWTEFRNDKTVKGKAKWECADVAESINSIYRGIKNECIGKAEIGGKTAYEAILGLLADNADMVQSELDRIYGVMYAQLKGKLSEEHITPIIHASCCYVFLYYANETQKLIYAGARDNSKIMRAASIVNRIHEVVGIPELEPIGELRLGGEFSKLIRMLTEEVDKHGEKTKTSVCCETGLRAKKDKAGKVKGFLEGIAQCAGLQYVENNKLHA